jgi:hypothetical protein
LEGIKERKVQEGSKVRTNSERKYNKKNKYIFNEFKKDTNSQMKLGK